MKKILFSLMLYIMIFGNISADEPPRPVTEYISQNNMYKLIMTERIRVGYNFREKWELIKIDTNESLYNFRYIHSLSRPKVIISDDGNNIVLVYWFLFVGNLWDNENTQTTMNRNIVEFYHMGEEIRRYRLSDLFSSIRNGIRSESHLQWTGYNRDKNSIRMENNTVIIRTLESFEYIFDIRTGIISLRRRI